MFRTFFLYLFPVLENVLPQVYFRHVCKLSYAIYAQLQEQISVEDVIKDGVLLKYFVLDFESLYGKKNVGINVHFFNPFIAERHWLGMSLVHINTYS